MQPLISIPPTKLNLGEGAGISGSSPAPPLQDFIPTDLTAKLMRVFSSLISWLLYHSANHNSALEPVDLPHPWERMPYPGARTLPLMKASSLTSREGAGFSGTGPQAQTPDL